MEFVVWILLGLFSPRVRVSANKLYRTLFPKKKKKNRGTVYRTVCIRRKLFRIIWKYNKCAFFNNDRAKFINLIYIVKVLMYYTNRKKSNTNFNSFTVRKNVKRKQAILSRDINESTGGMCVFVLFNLYLILENVRRWGVLKRRE